MSNKYPQEFKEKVMKDYKENGGSAKEIADKYGISDTTIFNWKNGYNTGKKKEEKQEKTSFLTKGKLKVKRKLAWIQVSSGSGYWGWTVKEEYYV